MSASGSAEPGISVSTDASVAPDALPDASTPDAPPGPPPAPPPRRTSPLATWSLILAGVPWIAVVVVVIVSESPTIAGTWLSALTLGCWIASVVTGVMAIRRIRRSDGQLKGTVRAAVGIGTVALSLVAGVVSTYVVGDELLRDDFEGAQSFWTGEDASVTKRYANGGYEIEIGDPSVQQVPSRSFLDEGPVEALSFSADATIVRGPDEDMAIALGCWASETSGYMLFVQPNGHHAIVDEGGVLTEGDGEPLTDEMVRLSIACDGGGPDTVLGLSVNGEPVVRFEDPDGPDRFAAVGFYVAAAESGTLVRFDDAVAARI